MVGPWTKDTQWGQTVEFFHLQNKKFHYRVDVNYRISYLTPKQFTSITLGSKFLIRCPRARWRLASIMLPASAELSI